MPGSHLLAGYRIERQFYDAHERVHARVEVSSGRGVHRRCKKASFPRPGLCLGGGLPLFHPAKRDLGEADHTFGFRGAYRSTSMSIVGDKRPFMKGFRIPNGAPSQRRYRNPVWQTVNSAKAFAVDILCPVRSEETTEGAVRWRRGSAR